MTRSTTSLPVIRRLPDDFSIERVFSHFASRAGCLWFDSVPTAPFAASAADDAAIDLPSARYSFLMSDPLRTLVAEVGDPDPWPLLEKWFRDMPSAVVPGLPPMQGGIAGLIGYEAATWLERVGVSRQNELPTPAISLGLYDWTIATDHHLGQSWLISQGFSVDADAPSPADRLQRANDRADQVESQIRLALERAPESTVARPSEARSDRNQVTSNFSSEGFREVIAEVVQRIRDGDSFQVNLAQRLLHPAVLSSAALYRRLREANPAPYSVYYHGDGFDVLSSSPELFLQLDHHKVQTRPIKGTVPRTGDHDQDQRLAESLQQSLKDRAENIMIVDLMRNDLSRVCTDESVQVRQLCQVERYQCVQHLVSIVEGELRDGCSIIDLLKACFPGGSVTGAPKIEAMRTIAELEPDRRGPYCGSMGYISCSGQAEFNILIRTITATRGQWQLHVGGGITARSNPLSEEAETWAKAEGILRALPAPNHGQETV
ncbi:Aminodeoxychorismate synthase component 1 [Novipirellula galeiformis]|uniref:Aminodeoxychorismate synthase component 1 n=1 Tax=Novipirellula galeiformis TaxID=2528004 RepID=A0A5C6CQS0_9BACT|nr:anthranilate synthase component I family protein [Novipirellula galeiformis]TWU26900.1 Aminodeoxychorismate synthase component 1 [Novipirellula galeiformis]